MLILAVCICFGVAAVAIATVSASVSVATARGSAQGLNGGEVTNFRCPRLGSWLNFSVGHWCLTSVVSTHASACNLAVKWSVFQANFPEGCAHGGGGHGAGRFLGLCCRQRRSERVGQQRTIMMTRRLYFAVFSYEYGRGMVVLVGRGASRSLLGTFPDALESIALHIDPFGLVLELSIRPWWCVG